MDSGTDDKADDASIQLRNEYGVWGDNSEYGVIIQLRIEPGCWGAGNPH